MDLVEVHRLGRSLLAEHGLSGWSFGFDNAKRRAGRCSFAQRRITVSRHLMALYDRARVVDTILHEVAHALVGAEHGHDAVWRATARSIGCTGERLVDAEAPRAPAPWRGTCPAGHVVERHRRPTRPSSCLRCAPGFDVAHLLRWTFHGRDVPLGADYDRALRAVLRGTRPTAPADVLAAVGALSPGQRIRITAPGRYLGVPGTVLRSARTRYHVRTELGLLTVPFAGVEAVRSPSAR